MAMIVGLETKFDEVVAEYDRWRPVYPSELYADIFKYRPIEKGSKVLEIGIGTGQATPPILEMGCSVTTVELGSNLAAFSKKKFDEYPNFEVLNMAFQDFDAPSDTFDLIYSASAFHWIPEELGYPKVLGLLKQGGAFARFANHPYKDKGNEPLHLAIQEAYAKYMPGNDLGPEYGEQQCKNRADAMKRYGFAEVEHHLYRRTRTFDSKGYVALLGTYSDHRALKEGTRAEFFRCIQDTIDRFGGKITVYDTLELQLGKRL